MKKIEATITPAKFDAVKKALVGAGMQGMTVSEVKEMDAHSSHTNIYRGTTYVVDFLPKLKLEVLVGEDSVAACVDVIEQAAKTGRLDDGEICVSGIDDIIRIRTGEHGRAAI